MAPHQLRDLTVLLAQLMSHSSAVCPSGTFKCLDTLLLVTKRGDGLLLAPSGRGRGWCHTHAWDRPHGRAVQPQAERPRLTIVSRARRGLAPCSGLETQQDGESDKAPEHLGAPLTGFGFSSGRRKLEMSSNAGRVTA